LPVAVFLKRLAAPLCVFNFGMMYSSLAFSNLIKVYSQTLGRERFFYPS
jgi:hypothetical protein